MDKVAAAIGEYWRPAFAGALSAMAVLTTALLTAHVGKSADWAAWVQAVGTIAAIVAATWIANRQSREAISRERRALQARWLAVSRLVSFVRVRISAELQAWEDKDGGKRVSDLTVLQFQSAHDRLAMFPLADIDNADVVFLLADALDVSGLVLQLIRQLHDTFRQSDAVGVKVVKDRIPVLRGFAESIAAIDDRLRDIAEPEWRAQVAAKQADATAIREPAVR